MRKRKREVVADLPRKRTIVAVNEREQAERAEMIMARLNRIAKNFFIISSLLSLCIL